MEKAKKLRAGVVINYLSLVLMVVLAGIGEEKGWNWTLGGFQIGLFILLVITFIHTQVKSGLWLFVHKRVEKLDEREQELSYEALRHSYAIFTIVVLTMLMFLTITNDSSFEDYFSWAHTMMRPFFLGFLYFAHTLPAAVLLWKRKSVFYEE